MEDGTDGRGGGPWSYREAIESSSGYTISSSSGTVSTAYTSSSSRLSSISMEAATHDVVSLEEEIDLEHIKGMVQEFFGTPSAINGAGDMSVLERWFTELGVGWVPRVADGTSAGELRLDVAAGRWIRALAQIMETISSAKSLFPNCLPSIFEEEPAMTDCEAQASIQYLFQFTRFTQEAMFKFLAFVDFIVALNPNTIRGGFGSNGVPALIDKLMTLLCVGRSLSKAVPNFEMMYLCYYPAPTEVERIQGEMVSLLSEKEGKAREAIWSTMEDTRTCILESLEDSWATQTPQGSPDIHKDTRIVMAYIRLQQHIYSSVPRRGKYVHAGDISLSTRPTIEMMSCLDEKLAKMSQSFPDQSLRFLFLINNIQLIHNEIHTLQFSVPKSHIHSKREDYIQSYLQVSWAPVLSCLSSTTHLFLGRYSPLFKFETEFQKTYTAQKLWKVPDPVLRKRLRKAIVERVAPGYRKYLEDNNVTTPRITPQELEEMLQELFEG